MKYTAEEVRAIAKRLHDDITVKDGDTLAASDMLTAYADRIEADEGAVPDCMIVLLNHIEGLMDSGILPEDSISADMWNAVSMHNFAHPPAQAAQVDESAALAHFTDYFVRNYPGPDTIIHDPRWHAPKIFRAAQYALARFATQQADR